MMMEVNYSPVRRCQWRPCRNGSEGQGCLETTLQHHMLHRYDQMQWNWTKVPTWPEHSQMSWRQTLLQGLTRPRPRLLTPPECCWTDGFCLNRQRYAGKKWNQMSKAGTGLVSTYSPYFSVVLAWFARSKKLVKSWFIRVCIRKMFVVKGRFENRGLWMRHSCPVRTSPLGRLTV